MHKVMQKLPDDCLRACLCSIFELDDSEVPNFGGNGWWDSFRAYCVERLGYAPIELNTGPGICAPLHEGITCIATGTTDRGSQLHAIVGRTVAHETDLMVEEVHDPHKSGGGLVELKAIMFFVPMEYV